ncbi:hypothetical protein QE152_g30859 [Popillia japonica]|uniref:Uncharacterized protein n=1 Tax=Popillia japonica TaxID=7064 RepID=A0AAW1JD55_POPJA
MMERWLRTNPGMKVTQFQGSELLSEAYGKGACIQTTVNGFKAVGIWPIDRGVFADHQFAAADNLCQEDQPMEDAEIKGHGSEENREDNPLETLINCQEDQPMEDAEIKGHGSEENREDNPLETLINDRRPSAGNLGCSMQESFIDQGPSTSGTNRNATNDEVKKSSLNVSIEENCLQFQFPPKLKGCRKELKRQKN